MAKKSKDTTPQPVIAPLFENASIEGHRRELREIPLDQLPMNGELVGPDPDPELVESIRLYGQFEPVLVAQFADGKIQLKDGGRRVKALRKLGKATAWSQVILDADDLSSKAWTIITNRVRSENPLSELDAILYYKDKGYFEEQICKAVGIGKQEYRKICKLANLDDCFRTAVQEHRMSISTAFEVAELPAALTVDLVKAANEGKKIPASLVREATTAQKVQNITGFQAVLPVIVPVAKPVGMFIVLPKDFEILTDEQAARDKATELNLAGNPHKVYKIVEI